MRLGRQTVAFRVGRTRSARIPFLIAAVVAISLGSWVIPSLTAPLASQAAPSPSSAAPSVRIGIASGPQESGGYWSDLQ